MKILPIIIIAIGLLAFTGCARLPNDAPAAGNANHGSSQPEKDTLDLSNQGLEKVPSYVFDLTGLKELNLSHNRLTGAIQAEVRRLQNLQVLDLSNNLLTGVPAEAGQLANLQILNLADNRLTGLPGELGNLKNLKTLNLSGNSYSAPDLEVIRRGLPTAVNIIVN